MNGPFLLVRATVSMFLFGFALWTRLLGPKRAKVVVGVGMAVSTVVAIVLETR